MKGATYQVGVSVRLRGRRGAHHHPGDDAARRWSAPRSVRHDRAEHQRHRRRLGDAEQPTSFSTDVSGLLLYVEAAERHRVLLHRRVLAGRRPRPRRSRATSRTARCRAGSRAAASTLTNTDRAGLRRHAQPEDHRPHRGIHRPQPPLTGQLTKGATYRRDRLRRGWSPGRPRPRSGHHATDPARRREAFDTVARTRRHRRGLGDDDRGSTRSPRT